MIKAAHARTDEEIKLATKLAAAALVSLGLLVLLREIVERMHELKPKAPEAENEPVRPPPRRAGNLPRSSPLPSTNQKLRQIWAQGTKANLLREDWTT